MPSSREPRLTEERFSTTRTSVGVALVYLVVGVAWILLSDWAVDAQAPSDAWEVRMQSVKGVAFVSVSSVLVGGMVLLLLRARSRYTEEVLQQERLFESIINDTPELICRFRPDGTIVHVNAAYGAYFNRSPDDLVGLKLFELVEPEDRPQVEALLSSLTPFNPTQTHEHRVLNSAGEERWQRWTNRAVFDDAGNVTEIQSIGRDITAEIKAEHARKHAMQELSNVMDALPGAVVLLNADGTVDFSNRVSQQAFNWATEELSGKDVAGLFEQESAQRLRDAMNEVLDRETPIRLSTTAAQESSDRHELDTVVFPVSGADGERRVGLYTYDLSQSSVLDRRERSHVERFGELFDLTGDGMAVFEVTREGGFGRPTALNHGMEQIVGYTRDELLEMKVTDLLSPKDRARALADMEQLLQSGQLVSEYEFVRQDGSTFTAEVSTRLFTEGSRRFVFCNVRDVTHRKEMEQQLRESEERYRAIFNTAADGIVLTHLDKMTLGNEQMERLFRVAPGGLVGRTIAEFSPEFQPDGRRSEDAFADYYDQVQRGGTVEFEWDYELPDGTAIRAWVRLRNVEIGSERYVIAMVRDVTEREQERRRLRESEKALRDAQSLAKLGSWSISVKSGEVLAASDEMYRLYNTTPEQSRKLEERIRLVHPGDRERVVTALKEATEGAYELEYRAMVDGKVRWMHSRADVVHDESVGGLVAHGTTQDITELKRAQRETEQAQGQLDSILQSVPVGIGILENGTIKWASAGLARITDRPVESLVGATLETVLSPEDMGRFAELRAHSDAANPLEAMQARLYTGDSIRRWVQIGVAPLHSPEGNGDTYTISMADITDLREAEEKIRELSAAVENAPVSIFITDLEGAIQYSNPWVEKVTGYSAEELIGQNPRIFKSDETPADQYTHLWESLQAGQSWHGDFQNKRKNGELFWERATISPILRESDGEPFRYIAIKQDITEAKQIEEELRRHENELEDIVRTRTAELVEARNVAVEADRLKSTFLASVSHELRTPLTSVIGFAEVLKEQSYGTLNDKQWVYVDHVLSSGKKLLDVINAILDLSRLDAGRMELEYRKFTLPTLIAHCIENVAATSDKNVAIEEEIDQYLWLTGVVADERKIRQVLLNLLTNAVTYTPEDGKITVRASLDNDTVRVAVADTGVGIPSEYLEEIFETFRQLNKDEFRHSKGTGLGLALTRRIIELHGGRAWAESDGPGLGSTFYLEFPLRSEKVAEPMGA